MIPGVYGFTWDAGNLLFLGIFFTVAITIGTTVIVASLRAARAIQANTIGSMRWHDDFQELPASLRTCRHTLSGLVESRVCSNGFDCRSCAAHCEILQRAPETAASVPATFGVAIPADRKYHRGHTWVRQEDDGVVSIGLDPFAQRLIGKPDRIVLPEVGAALSLNAEAWTMERNGVQARILSPVDGEVVGTSYADSDWCLRVRPSCSIDAMTYLLNVDEVAGWMNREFEHLQSKLGDATVGPTLADGGELTDDLPATYPQADWESVWSDTFLEA